MFVALLAFLAGHKGLISLILTIAVFLFFINFFSFQILRENLALQLDMPATASAIDIIVAIFRQLLE